MASKSGPFNELAPPSPSCGTYSGLIPKPSYDVFINHRGPDVKQTLASALYAIITSMQRTAFLDSQELRYGDFLPKEIEAAMSSALLHIAIFSKRYAESPWCLAEISFMLKTGAIIIPIFYHVEPSDLRSIDQGEGAYSNDFKKHQEKGRYSSEQLEEWRMALHKASFLEGQIIKNEDDEKKLLKNIGNTILKILKPLTVAKYPVGISEIVEDFEESTFQCVQSYQKVHVVGICGTGGSGKTALAKEIYNRRSPLMESSSFIFDVRDAAARGMLRNKQLKVLKDLGVECGSIQDLEDGKKMLARHLRSVRVLIVLDDVDHLEQLDALMPVKEDSLCQGSLLIVTSRKNEVLKSWGVSSVYEMKEMDVSHAEQLFCWHAFSKPTPVDGFEELVKKFVGASKGLPLYLKELGTTLYGNSSHEFWECQLDKISRVMPRNIKKAQC